MRKTYQTFIDIPSELAGYLSLDQLNQDYWANCMSRDQQSTMEAAARHWLNLDLDQYQGQFNIETKVEDISTDQLPIVPKLCDQQGLIFIWTVPLDQADEVTSAAMLFKTEPQSVKSVVPDNCEVLIAQVHVYDDCVFIASVKYYNYIAKYPKAMRLQLCQQVWSMLIDLFKTKVVYAANGGVLNTAHNLFNNKNIQREPYRRKMLMSLGFRETTVSQAPAHFYMADTDKIWKYEHKPSA